MGSKQRFIVLLFLALGFVGASGTASASERILLFNSDITVETSGAMTVQETIRVNAEENQIKRGIYRDFPTVYKTASGRTVRTPFKVISVTRDNQPEPWHTENIDNGKRVYFGQADIFLPSGVYEYTFTYKTNRQIGFFEDFDELYWNVTGNDWAFPIDKATAIIRLPSTAAIQQNAAYTGLKGETGKDFEVRKSQNAIGFQTTRPLALGEGLTVAVGWQKGVILEPTWFDTLKSILTDYPAIGILWASFFGLLLFYTIAWHIVGKDPVKPAIMPIFHPPEGISPAGCRYLLKMEKPDMTSVAAAIINLAVKGFWKIKRTVWILGIWSTYTLAKHTKDINGTEQTFSVEEIALQNLVDTGDFTFAQSRWQSLRSAIDKFNTKLVAKFGTSYLTMNPLLTGIGILAAIANVILFIVTIIDTLSGKAIFAPLIVFVIVLSAILDTIQKKSIFPLVQLLAGLAILIIIFCYQHFIASLVSPEESLISLILSGLSNYIYSIDWIFTGALSLPIIGLITVQVLFSEWLKRPTELGQKLRAEIEGFKLYLGVTEKDRFNALNPPEKTPELFEKYLPYAIALDVGNEWGDQFANVLSSIDLNGETYNPRWYDGDDFSRLGARALTTGLGAGLSQAVSSNSSPPSSSGSSGSGSSGGGSSGGGRGGGGGGGW